MTGEAIKAVLIKAAKAAIDGNVSVNAKQLLAALGELPEAPEVADKTPEESPADR